MRPKRRKIEIKIIWIEQHMIWIKFDIIIIVKRPIIQATALNLKKTSFCFGNLCPSDSG